MKHIFGIVFLRHTKAIILKRRINVAISEDLKSIQLALRAMPGIRGDTIPLMRLICSNLQSIIEQVEHLENVPLAIYEPLPSSNQVKKWQCN